MENLTGLIAATFTPMQENGRLDLDAIPAVVDQLINEQVQGLYVCGGTGEGVSLSTAERQATVEAFIAAAAGHIPVIAQVGHNSLMEAKALAAHAAAVGADAISAIPPLYFKPDSIDTVLDCLAEITSAAPDLPFIYYHIPPKTGLTFDLPSMLEQCPERLPSLVGVKYSDSRIDTLQACLMVGAGDDGDNGRYRFYFGSDEQLLGGLTAGVVGAIGTTYNFAAPLYQRIIEAQPRGDYETARQQQALTVKMVRTIHKYGGIPAHKAVMSLIGLHGPTCRLPNQTLSTAALAALKQDLEAIGFFDWAR
ncbi:MAG: dihydrodipicolinate synthase family protein [Chloroflexota bacterium]